MKVRKLIWFEIYFICFFGLFRDFLHIPGRLIYVLDLITLAIYGVSLGRLERYGKGAMPVFVVIYLTFAVSILRYLVMGYPITQFIAGFRYKFLCYFFFMACAECMQSRDVDKLLRGIDALFFINLFVVTAEYLLGYHGDYLSGTFGIIKGGNGYMNILLIAVSTGYVLRYLQKEIPLRKLILAILGCMYIMALAELKVFLFELVLIIVMAMMMSGFSVRKIMLVGVLGLGAAFGVAVMGMIFSGSGFGFFTAASLSKYLGSNGYTGQGDLNRFNAVLEIRKQFFMEDWGMRLLGYGLGACHYGTPFLVEHASMHYQWFTDSFIYIEGGFIGLALFEGVFVVIALKCRKLAKRMKNNPLARRMAQTGMIMALCGILLSVYDVTLLERGGYLLYFVCAMPLIGTKNLAEAQPKAKRKKRWKLTMGTK